MESNQPNQPNTAPAKAKGKSTSVTLTGEGDNRIRISAIARKDGTYKTAVHFFTGVKNEDGKITGTTGCSKIHPSMEAALTQVQQHVAEALKAGWKQKRSVRGMNARPDAFAVIPSPNAKVPAKAVKK